MFNLFNLSKSIVQKRRYLVVDESDVMIALKAISKVKNDSKFHFSSSMEVGNCGWADDANAWFIHFDATGNQWRNIIAMLIKDKYNLVLKEDDRLYLRKEG